MKKSKKSNKEDLGTILHFEEGSYSSLGELLADVGNPKDPKDPKVLETEAPEATKEPSELTPVELHVLHVINGTPIDMNYSLYSIRQVDDACTSLLQKNIMIKDGEHYLITSKGLETLKNLKTPDPEDIKRILITESYGKKSTIEVYQDDLLQLQSCLHVMQGIITFADDTTKKNWQKAYNIVYRNLNDGEFPEQKF